MKKQFVVLMVMVAMACLACVADAREWTDRNGFKYDGLFSGLVNGVVEIDSNGRIIKIPFDDLSDEDQEYVRQMVAQQGGNAPPDNGNAGQDDSGGPTGQPSGGGPISDFPNLNTRQWRDNNSNTIDGRFGGLVDENTIVIFQDNQRIEVPIANLSQADQDYVSQVVELFDPRVHGRDWSPANAAVFRGSYIQLKVTEVWILTSFDDELLEIEAVELSDTDLAFISDMLNERITEPPQVQFARFRVWTAADGSWKAIGRLKDYTDSEVLLEQDLDDISIPIASLSLNDQDLVREMFPDEDQSSREEEGDGDGITEYEDSGFDWSRYYSMHPVFYVLLAVSVLGLIFVIAFKYINESFQDDDDSL